MTQPVAAGARPGRVVAVLGMHRSGTSALAGSLEQHGLFLGRVSTSNPHNPKGNRESAEVRRLNEDVLRVERRRLVRPARRRSPGARSTASARGACSRPSTRASRCGASRTRARC